MLIKQQTLTNHLRHKLAAIYILIGQDHFLLNEAANSIKQAWQSTYKEEEREQTILHINNPADWSVLDEEANSYSLFAKQVLIDIRYEKKTLDAAGKTFLTNYLQSINPHCLLVLRASNLTQKQLQSFLNQDNLHIIQANPLNDSATQQWITQQLQQKFLQFEKEIPQLIHQYTRGNMLACAQVIEKLSLIADKSSLVTVGLVKEQLVDQCAFQLYELADACLASNPAKAIQLLRNAASHKEEPTLILWILTQEIRLLIQLFELINQSIPFNTACNQLKIWPQKQKFYQLALKKQQLSTLLQLLNFCKLTDIRIKSTQSSQIWHAFEQIALSLCLAKPVGHFA